MAVGVLVENETESFCVSFLGSKQFESWGDGRGKSRVQAPPCDFPLLQPVPLVLGPAAPTGPLQPAGEPTRPTPQFTHRSEQVITVGVLYPQVLFFYSPTSCPQAPPPPHPRE